MHSDTMLINEEVVIKLLAMLAVNRAEAVISRGLIGNCFCPISLFKTNFELEVNWHLLVSMTSSLFMPLYKKQRVRCYGH